MTRRLVLIRHAKAAPDAATDRQRPLAPRGQRQSVLVGQWLQEHDLCPDHAVVSPATRALQTWQLLSEQLAGQAVVVTDERVYRNTVADLLDALRALPAEASTVALVGHNPSVHALARTLDDGRGDAAAREAVAAEYPTAAVSVFALAGDWAALAEASATLQAFTRPRG